MTALVTIFMHVIHDPLASSTSHDIALMDAVVGFFGRLEYVTSGEAAFTQMGEFVRQVRHIVATLRDDATRQQTQLPTSSAEQDRRASVTSPRLIVTDENIAQSNCHFPASTDSGSERYSTAIGGHGTVPQPLGRSSAAMFSQVLQDTYHVPAVAESTLVLDEDPSRAGILESAELPDGNFLNNLAMPILGLSPGSVPSSDWLDAWISPRQIEGLGSDLPTELNITGR
jgi:hypothetical protein